MGKVIALDLDGTLLNFDGHYVSGKPDAPLDGALAFVKKLRERGHTVVIFTARSNTKKTQEYLVSHGFPELRVTSEKFGFDMLLDDRAVNFPGPTFYDNVDKAVETLENFKPWWNCG